MPAGADGAPTALASRSAPDAPAAAGRAGAAPDTAHPTPSGPAPATGAAPLTPEPAAAKQVDDDGGSWWSWLTSGISRFFGSLHTSDPAVSTDAGPRPQVDLTGDADPGQGAVAEHQAGTAVGGAHTEADQATHADFGEQDVRPTGKPETIRAAIAGGPGGAGAAAAGGGAAGAGAAGGAAAGLAGAGAAGGGAAGLAGAGAAGAASAAGGGGAVAAAGGAAGAAASAGGGLLPADLLAAFDAGATPELQAQAVPQAQEYGEKQAEYQRSTAATQADGHRQLQEADEATRREQEDLRSEVRKDVSGERERWNTENAQITERFGTQASARRTAVEQEIKTKVASTHTEAETKLTAAEQQAATAKQRAEAEAEAKKKAEEDRPKSWWERAKGAVSGVFNAIRSAVSAIFDTLRAAVKAIIETAKSVVHGLIEAARSVVVGLIKTFGAFVKGLVTLALAAFPEAARKARAWIDRRVDQATQAVNRAAAALKAKATAILDEVGTVLDGALKLLQKGLTSALDFFEKLALAPFKALEVLAKIAKWIAEHSHFIEGAQRLMDDPDAVIQGMKKTLGGMIAAAPAKAIETLDTLAGKLGPKALKHERGIRRYLTQSLEHLKESWWEELKKMGWTLLWPWPTVWTDIKAIATAVPKCLSAVFHLRVSDAIDEFLGMTQKANSILGAVYGWFFIASVLVGTIIGAFFGGAGALPGALAGAAFAGEVGEALVIALIATEGAIILKSAADLAIGNDKNDEDEHDYQQIAGSTLTIAITGAMMLLGELAADLAKAIWNGAKGLFKSAGGEAAADAAAGAAHGTGEVPEGKVDAPETKPADAPEGTAETPEGTGEVINGEKVVASEKTPDGHEVKVTEEGRCLICSTCEEVAVEFKAELKADAELKAEFDTIVGEADPKVKAEKLAEFERKLAEARTKAAEPEAPAEEPKAPEMKRQEISVENLKFSPDPAKLTVEPGRTKLELNLHVEDAAVDGGKQWLGQVEITLGPDGEPRVEMLIEARAKVGGEPHALDFVDANGERVGMTDKAIEQANEASRNAFGEDPAGFDGSLGMKNKENFIVEWETARAKLAEENPGMSSEALDKAAGDQAIREISFGKARVDRGFTDIEVDIKAFKEVGTPPRRVPDVIHVKASKPGGGTAP